MNKNFYVYGTFYDSGKELFPSEIGKCDVVVYCDPSEVPRTIGSLEGLFVSESPLVKDKSVNPRCQAIIKRTQMKKFEKEYNGRFHPFKQK